jgi:excisionase family DNA binding protein
MGDVRIITITPDELRALVREAVREEMAAKHVDPVEWIDATEAAKLLGVGTRTIQRLAKAGELPCTKLGTLLRFNRAAIDERLRRAG